MPRPFFVILLLLTACASELPVPVASGCGFDDALAACIQPTREPAYYTQQAHKYFDSLDGDAPVDSIPEYSELVARYEWEPWLKLTGIGRDMMIGSSIAVTRLATPSTVPQRDCRFFPTQPFARCRVVIEYAGGPCPIYEEFTFNEAGEMTFIEAWSDQPGLLPTSDPNDPWAEGDNVKRLATRLPGLGRPDGLIDLESGAMRLAEETDEDVADFALRARSFWLTWFHELSLEAGVSEEDVYGYGCGWE